MGNSDSRAGGAPVGEVQAFRSVVEHGSFTAAAESLELSKSAVSKYVSRLERRLGVRLLNRTTRRQTLTEAGEAYFRRVSRALDELARADREVAEQADRPRGRLRVSAPTFFGGELLAPRIAGFLERCPDVTLEIVHSNRFVDLVEERFDVAIRIAAPRDSALVIRPLAEIPLVLCAAPGYLERFGRPRRPDDLADHRCLLYSLAERPDIWTLPDSDGTPTRVAVRGGLRTDSDHVLRRAAIDGAGIARLPRLFVADALAGGRLEALWPDRPAVSVTLAAVFPSREDLPAKTRAFVDYLVECAGDWR
ncbi:MAG: LysR family transcriptional regulator [Wenzhouxiangellaceae bacterium]|nr:LysR family transcriptional regulator [Wenzhouxiangellaceae bacterium]